MNEKFDKEPLYQALCERRRLALDFSEIEGQCVYAHFNCDSVDGLPRNDFQLQGAVFFLVSRGKVNVRHKDLKYQMTGPSLMVFPPGGSVCFNLIENVEAEVHALYVTYDFMQDLNLSLSVLSSEEFIERPRPDVELTEKELSQVMRFCKIMSTAMADDYNQTLSTHIVSSMVCALIYQLMVFAFKRVDVTLSERTPNRRSNYVREFLKLVHLNYTRERSVAYYASKLCVSPKYLSILLKESTGRSAASWIDHFVIMEAKNLLRFSGKNVQQVAYALNFVNQSAFGKYFKHITGMSPTEYQKQN